VELPTGKVYNCELCNTRGVIVRLADTPWGPWSAPKIIFDPDDGYGKFIHEPGKDILYDPTRDGPYDKGHEYGPYQMAPYSTGVKGRYTKIYFTMSTWNPYQVMQMSAIIPSEEEERDPKPYANSLHDRNDRKYAHVSILLAHLAKINNVDLKKNSPQANSSYIADHIEWAQFQSSDQLRTEIKSKFRQLVSPLSADTDKAEVYIATLVAVAGLTHDYNTFKNSIDETIHRKWALNAIHTGHKEWLISEIEQAVDNEHFLLSNDHLCYAHDPYDSNEFKYARMSLLVSNLANNWGTKGDFQMQGSVDWNSYIAWARFRSVQEMRQELLKKIQQIIYNLSTADSIAHTHAEIVQTILELTEDDLLYKEEDYSKDYEWALSASTNNKQEIIVRISRLLYSDHFLIPVGQKSSQ
jgi:predicted transcriptional regulator